MNRKAGENFLDYIPVRNPEFSWKLNEKENVVIAMKNKGFFNRIGQIFFQKPKVSYIELDVVGTFVWQQMDGKQDVYEIGERLKKSLGETAGPFYMRLCCYIKTLGDHKLIRLLRKRT